MLRRRSLPALVLAALLAGCSSGRKAAGERLPLTQASFHFAQSDDGDVQQSETAEISPLSDGTLHYELTLLTTSRSNPSVRDERTMTDYVTDPSGQVTGFFQKGKKFNSMGESQVKGRLIHLWMPTASRKDGGEIALEGFPDPLKVSGPTSWKSWSVWKATFRNQQYLFDAKTGFLVGNIAGSDTWVLDQSSVPGLAP